MIIEGIPVAQAATVAFEDALAEAISFETGDYTADDSTVMVRYSFVIIYGEILRVHIYLHMIRNTY